MANWERELRRFIKRYYGIEVIKGLVFFLAIASILWLIGAYAGLALGNNVAGRGVLLLVLICSFGLLAWRYWLPGLMVLIGLKKGISLEDGARLIRKWLPDAKDKLLNTIELREKSTVSNLWDAAYKQHENEVSKIELKLASPWSEIRGGLKWIWVPIIMVVFISVSGQWSQVRKGTERVISYSEVVDLYAGMNLLWSVDIPESVVEGESLALEVANTGTVQPDLVYVEVNGVEKRMVAKNGKWVLRLERISEELSIAVRVGGIQRLSAEVELERRPRLDNGKIQLIYPDYLKKEKEAKSVGDKLVVPRGTKVLIGGKVSYGKGSRVARLNGEEKILKETDLNYELMAQDDDVLTVDFIGEKNSIFPGFGVNVEVTEDEYPVVLDDWIQEDSVLINQYSLLDDYGLLKMNVEATLVDESVVVLKKEGLSGTKRTGEFALDPWGLLDSLGPIRSLRVSVWDNDKPKGYKNTKGNQYTWTIKNKKEEAKEQINSFSSLSDQMVKNQEEWSKKNKDLENTLQENRTSEASWKSRNELKSQAEELKRESDDRKRRLEKRKEILKDWDQVNENQDIDDILERLDEVEKKENRRKLDELMKKLDEKKSEDLLKRLEQERKKSEEMRISEKRLDEMMKRAEVDMRFQLSMEELEELKEQQEELADKTGEGEETAQEQEELKKELEEWNKEFEEMLKRNEELKDPFEMKDMRDSRQESSEKMDEAAESSKDQQKNSEEKMQDQKESAEKLEEMLEEMQSLSSSMSQDQHMENMETLRQIQDNLLVYSNGEEGLTSALKEMVNGDPALKNYQEEQQKLRSGAEVIQDSLRALAERVPMIKESVFSKLKRMESASRLAQEAMGEQQLGQASSESQYAMTAANELALMLDETMQQMQAQMNSMMAGKGNCSKPGGAKPSQAGMQKAQKQLMGGMKQGLNKGKGKKKSEQKGEQEGSGKAGENGEGKGGLSAKEFAQLLQQQEALRSMWEQMMQESEASGGGVGDAKVLELMQESEKELAEMKLTEKSIERQQEIETRLLKSDKAERQKGKEEKRESKTGKEGMKERNTSGSEDEDNQRSEIERLIRLNPEYRNYYRGVIQDWQRGL